MDPDIAERIRAFIRQYGIHNQHPRRPLAWWIGEVMSRSTRMGYWEWVAYETLHDQEPT